MRLVGVTVADLKKLDVMNPSMEIVDDYVELLLVVELIH